MMSITKEQLAAIADSHKLWIEWKDGRIEWNGGRRADLRGMDLRGMDLRGMDLRGMELIGADMRGANLRGVDLSETDMREVDLRDADIRETGLPPVPIVERIDAKILAAIRAGGKLEMSEWHTCETTHCVAGWAIVIAGDAGKKLESRLGTTGAAALIYAASRLDKSVPDFYASNKDAMAELEACASS